MKALEILKESRLFIEQQLSEFTKNIISYEHKRLIEAIAELEELIAKDKSKNCEECYNKTKLAIEDLENRSCNNCKHWELGWCFKLGSSLDIGGCGDYWEQK